MLAKIAADANLGGAQLVLLAYATLRGEQARPCAGATSELDDTGYSSCQLGGRSETDGH